MAAMHAETCEEAGMSDDRGVDARPHAAAFGWKKSSRSMGGDCVEVSSVPGGLIAVRDSKNSLGPRLSFTADEWRAFTDNVRHGLLDQL
jgi:hypothetical protein